MVEPVRVEAGLDEYWRENPAVGDAVAVEPVSDGILAVGGLDRAERRRLRDQFHGSFLELDQGFQGGVAVPPRGDDAKLLPHPGDPFAQRRRRTNGGSGR